MPLTNTLQDFVDAYYAAAIAALVPAFVPSGRLELPNRRLDPTVFASGIWARASMVHGTTERAVIRPPQYRRTGFVAFQFFVRDKQGTDEVYAAVDGAVGFLEDANENQSILNARFINVAPEEVGDEEQGGLGGRAAKSGWWQMNVVGEFNYDVART